MGSETEPIPVRQKVYLFGDYELNPEAFSLLHKGHEVSLEPQVFALLNFLVVNRHQLVSKNEILDEIWGHRFVSDSALATQIKSLRRFLGDDGRKQSVIKTVHGRGYRFVAEIDEPASTSSVMVEAGEAATLTPSVTRQSNLGLERTPLFGRESELERCIQAFDSYRMVSLLGIGGTGKTRLAKSVGRQVQGKYSDGVWFVDLVPVRDSGGIDTAIAAVMGVGMDSGTSRVQLAATINDRQTLIILDNCEHIEDDVAEVLDYFLEYTEHPNFLVTSRDPIDLADELRFFIDPLPVRVEAGLSPSAQLFFATAQRHGVSEQLDERLVHQVCARLDGLPLAIELAAAQLKQLTLDELVARLDRRFELLAGRQRTGNIRQDSLIEVLEDTWKLLNEEEQHLLGQLAVFPGQFTMTDIEQVFQHRLPQGISFGMSRLVELCVLSRTSRSGAWWRLLETVRIFALEKLSPSQREENAERHASWCLERLSGHPQSYLQTFEAATWASDHFADITAAEDYYVISLDLDKAIHICCGVSLMIQLDDGARALAKLQRIEKYFEQTQDTLSRVKLHAMAALCAQVTRNPSLLAEHALQNLNLCRTLDEPSRLVSALILSSLNNNFSDPPLAKEQLAEAMELAESSGEVLSARLARTYQAWSLAMRGEYQQAIDLAKELVNLDELEGLDNPTCNAICTIISCSVLTNPKEAILWTDRISSFARADALWGASLVYACSRAAVGQLREAACLCMDIKTRLRKAGRDPWPDLYVPLAVLATQMDEIEYAGKLIDAVHASQRPLQTFHAIAIYRQLRNKLNDVRKNEVDLSPASQLATLQADSLAWLEEIISV